MTDPTPPITPNWTPPPPQYGYGYPVARPTNGLAIAAMVCAIVALPLACFTYGVAGIISGSVGAVLGHVGRKKIRERDEQGGGMALTGIILGWISVGLSLLYLVGMVLFIVYGFDYMNELEQSGGGSSDFGDRMQGMLMAWLP